MVGLVVCTVYTDDQPYKPCVLCQTGLTVCQSYDFGTYPILCIKHMLHQIKASQLYNKFLKLKYLVMQSSISEVEF